MLAPQAKDSVAFLCRARLCVHNADAIEWLKKRYASQEPPLDIVFVDAFDGDNNVPQAFTDAGKFCV